MVLLIGLDKLFKIRHTQLVSLLCIEAGEDSIHGNRS